MRKFQHIIILAAGKSSRFWPLTDKNFFPFLSTPTIEHQLKSLSDRSEKITIVANFENKSKLEAIASRFSGQVPISVLLQEGVGIADAVLTASKQADEEVLIINSADFFEVELLDTVLEKATTTSADVVTIAKKTDTYFPGGYIRFEKDRVVDIIEKPDKDKLPSSYIKLVVDYFKNLRDFATLLEKTKESADGRYEKALVEYIHLGKKVACVTYEGQWVSLKYPWHVLDATDYFLKQVKNHRGANVQIADSAILEGEVYIDDNVKVFEYAKISGPAYIGKNTIVGNYSMILQSMIGDECLIGGYSEVTRSYLGNKVFIHRNYIGDSVVDANVVLGGGVVLANWRFDQGTIKSSMKGELLDTNRVKFGAIAGRDVKIGVNAAIMPGVKIGSGCHILPQQIVTRDITKDS